MTTDTELMQYEIELAKQDGRTRRKVKEWRVWAIFFGILAALFLTQIVVKSYFGIDIFQGGYCPMENCN